MTKKRLSLFDIEKEDSQLVPEKKSEPEKSMTDETRNQSKPIEFERKIVIVRAGKEKDDLSDYTKMSVTVPVDIFERLQDISRQRRRGKQPFKLTELVREALSDWLPKQT